MSEVFLHLWIVLVTKCKRGWGTLHCWYSHSTDSKWSLQRNPAGNCYGSQIENNSHCSKTPIAMSPASGFFKLAKLTGRKISLAFNSSTKTAVMPGYSCLVYVVYLLLNAKKNITC